MQSAAFTHIEYPLELSDIVVTGYVSTTTRSFTVRPVRSGRYMLAVWPRDFPLAQWVWRRTLSFATVAAPALREVFDLQEQATSTVGEWSWSLTLIADTDQPPPSELVFGGFATARGELRFEISPFIVEVRTVAWSCHQPFATVNGVATLEPTTARVFDWYRELLADFNPNVIWGEGDSGYSDGTPATNFADQVYNRPGWSGDAASRDWLKDAYRRMYRYHWSFDGLTEAMRRYPHILMWDDHEIHDGWGSEDQDFSTDNLAMFDIAKVVANEYVLNVGPRVRSDGDAHQAYITGPQAAFIFDSRTSRRYADPGGRIVSDAQIADFRTFCATVAATPAVRVLILGTTVPFLYIKDVLETLGSRAPKVVTDKLTGVRDDLRDSWLAPGNQEALSQLLDVVRDLLWRRPTLHVVNVSGDIHVSNAFQMLPLGFPRPIYQVTTSALTNRGHLVSVASQFMTMGAVQMLPVLGVVRKLWDEITDPNVLCITTSQGRTVLHLSVCALEGSNAVDQELVLD